MRGSRSPLPVVPWTLKHPSEALAAAVGLMLVSRLPLVVRLVPCGSLT